MPYDAFISYNQRADIAFAPKLQSALQSLAKPWWRYRALAVFRDESDLGAASSLTEKIQAGVAGSRYFVLLASPGAAASPWVAREIECWFARSRTADFDPSRHLLIARTDGEIVWDEARRDFDWSRTTALPPILKGRFEEEPLWIDLRGFKAEEQLTLRHPEFARNVARLAAPIRDTTPAALIDDNLRRSRQARRAAYAAVGAILLSALGAGWGWRSAFIEADRAAAAAARAEREAERARSEEAKAKQALEQEAAERLRAQRNESQHLAALARTLFAAEDDERGDELLIRALPRRTPAGLTRPEVPEVATLAAERLISASRRVLILAGHDALVRMALFTPDGRRVLTAGRDGTSRIWDAENGRVLAQMKQSEGDDVVRSASISANGTRALTSGNHGARLWDMATGRMVAEMDAHAASPEVAFSPDGKLALTFLDNSAYLWDAESGREIKAFVGHEGEVLWAAFSADGARIVTAAKDSIVRIWLVATGEQIAVLRGHDGWVTSAAFDPAGKRVLTTSMDKGVRIWDVESAKVTLVLGRDAEGAKAAFSPDGRRLLTTVGNTVQIWDSATGRPLTTLNAEELVAVARFSADGKYVLAAGIDATRVWDLESGVRLATLRGHEEFNYTGGDVQTQWAAFSPDGRRVVTASHDRTARIWDVERMRASLVLAGGAANMTSPAYSRDGKWLVAVSDDKTARVWAAASGRAIATLSGHADTVRSAEFDREGRRVVTSSYDRTARIWDAGSGRELTVLRGHEDDVYTAVFSPDGRHVATASKDGTARIWDGETGRPYKMLSGHEGEVTAVEFSPDGHRVVTASADSTARVWESETGRVLAILRGHADVLNLAVFGPDGRRVLTSSYDSTARLWNPEDGRELARLKHDDFVLFAEFDPAGKRVITASRDRTAAIWDAETGRLIHRLRGHRALVTRAVFSPDGELVLTESSDFTARLWDARSGREIASLRGPAKQVSSAAFSPDGRYVVTAGDAALRIWPVPLRFGPGELAELLLLRMHRDLRADKPDASAKRGEPGCAALAAHPFDPAYRGRPTAARIDDPELAVRRCREELSAKPDDAGLKVLLARALIWAKRNSEAEPLLVAAIRAGNPMAHHLMGTLRRGESAEGNAIAAKHYRAAVDAGLMVSAQSLGELLWGVEGVAPDRARAKALWREAAAAGIPHAHANLAVVAQSGDEGAALDALYHSVLALRLYTEAGYTQQAAGARTRLANVAQSATIVELQNALRRVDEWRSSPKAPRLLVGPPPG